MTNSAQSIVKDAREENMDPTCNLSKLTWRQLKGRFGARRTSDSITDSRHRVRGAGERTLEAGWSLWSSDNLSRPLVLSVSTRTEGRKPGEKSTKHASRSVFCDQR